MSKDGSLILLVMNCAGVFWLFCLAVLDKVLPAWEEHSAPLLTAGEDAGRSTKSRLDFLKGAYRRRPKLRKALRGIGMAFLGASISCCSSYQQDVQQRETASKLDHATNDLAVVRNELDVARTDRSYQLRIAEHHTRMLSTNDDGRRLLFSQFLALNDIIATGNLSTAEAKSQLLNFSNEMRQVVGTGFDYELHREHVKREIKKAMIIVPPQPVSMLECRKNSDF